MTYKMDDVTKSDKDAIAKWASDPRFFYVYINDGISDPAKAAKAGEKYAQMCDLALQGRKSDLSVSEQEGNNLVSRSLSKGVSELSNMFVKLASPWDTVHAKGLRDERNKLIGLTVLLHEKETGKTEIGYMLDPDYHGQGLGTPMVMSALNWARQNTDMSVLKADVDPSNGASCGILNKLGLEKTEYKEVGPYKNRDGSAIPSQILEGGMDKVDAAIQTHLAKGGELYVVKDAVLDRKIGRTIGVNLDGVEHDEHRM